MLHTAYVPPFLLLGGDQFGGGAHPGGSDGGIPHSDRLVREKKMFTTDVIDEVCIGNGSILSGDTKLWKRFSTASPFFQIAGTHGHPEEAEDDALFMSDPYDLARLATATRTVYGSELGEVMIFTPHSLNGCGKWLFQTLHAMFYVINGLTGKCGFVYVTSGGVYGVIEEDEMSQYSKEVLYQSKHYALNLFEDYIDTRRIKL